VCHACRSHIAEHQHLPIRSSCRVPNKTAAQSMPNRNIAFPLRRKSCESTTLKSQVVQSSDGTSCRSPEGSRPSQIAEEHGHGLSALVVSVFEELFLDLVQERGSCAAPAFKFSWFQFLIDKSGSAQFVQHEYPWCGLSIWAYSGDSTLVRNCPE